MRGVIAFALATGGCADFAGIGDPKPLAPDAPPVPCAFDNIDLCLYASPRNDLVLDADLVLNTDRDCDLVYNNPIGRSACVLYARTITVDAKVTPRGTRPLILAATDSIELRGTLDLSGYVPAGLSSVVPAAGNDRDCAVNMIDAAGPGGSFNGRGGNGGTSAAGVVATSAPAIPLPDHLRGGCGGASGLDNRRHCESQHADTRAGPGRHHGRRDGTAPYVRSERGWNGPLLGGRRRRRAG